ncbi:unnamed protein product, partial [Ectocarpus sp. 4 AP-2014]
MAAPTKKADLSRVKEEAGTAPPIAISMASGTTTTPTSNNVTPQQQQKKVGVMPLPSTTAGTPQPSAAAMASMFGSFPGMFNAAAFAAAAAAAFPAGAKGLPKLAPVAPAAASAASPPVLCLAPKTSAAAAGKPPPSKRRKRGRNEDGDATETGGAAAADAVKLEEVNGGARGPLPAGRTAGGEQ